MTTVVTSMRFACRRRTAADWTSGNEILLAGEIGVETDLLPNDVKAKIGDGVTAWNSLGYAVDTTASGSGSAAWGAITGTLTDQTDLVAALALKVPTSRTVNGQPLSGNVTLTASDVGAATAAQGATADSAVQPGDLATVATSGAYADLSGKPTLGTAAATAATDYATAAQGALADSAVQDIAATIHAATSKATPVDADEFGIVDSAAPNVLKKLTWANLKATLKPYFDTLYAAMPFTTARFTLQTSVPSAASTGEAKLAIRDIAGFGLAQIRNESGHHVLLPSITDPLLRGAFLATGTTRQYCNMPGIIAGSGTSSAVNYGGINFTNLASAASSGSPADNYVNSAQLVTSGGAINGYLTWMPFQLPDASYGSGATGCDIFVGVNSSNSATAVDTSVRIPTGQVGAGFHYSTTLSDTNWQFTVRDGSGSNITTTDTGMAFAAQKLYFAMIYAPASGSNTYWFLANMTDGTIANGSTARKHGATAAKEIVLLVTRTTTARNIRCNDFWTLMGGGSVTY